MPTSKDSEIYTSYYTYSSSSDYTSITKGKKPLGKKPLGKKPLGKKPLPKKPLAKPNQTGKNAKKGNVETTTKPKTLSITPATKSTKTESVLQQATRPQSVRKESNIIQSNGITDSPIFCTVLQRATRPQSVRKESNIIQPKETQSSTKNPQSSTKNLAPRSQKGHSCPLRVALHRSWSGNHLNMAKIDWPDFKTDGLIVVWRRDEELIVLPIKNGRVGFGVHEIQGRGSSLLQNRGFSREENNTLQGLLESTFAGKHLKESKQDTKTKAKNNNNASATMTESLTVDDNNNNENISTQIHNLISGAVDRMNQPQTNQTERHTSHHKHQRRRRKERQTDIDKDRQRNIDKKDEIRKKSHRKAGDAVARHSQTVLSLAEPLSDTNCQSENYNIPNIVTPEVQETPQRVDKNAYYLCASEMNHSSLIYDTSENVGKSMTLPPASLLSHKFEETHFPQPTSRMNTSGSQLSNYKTPLMSSDDISYSRYSNSFESVSKFDWSFDKDLDAFYENLNNNGNHCTKANDGLEMKAPKLRDLAADNEISISQKKPFSQHRDSNVFKIDHKGDGMPYAQPTTELLRHLVEDPYTRPKVAINVLDELYDPEELQNMRNRRKRCSRRRRQRQPALKYKVESDSLPTFQPQMYRYQNSSNLHVSPTPVNRSSYSEPQRSNSFYLNYNNNNSNASLSSGEDNSSALQRRNGAVCSQCVRRIDLQSDVLFDEAGNILFEILPDLNQRKHAPGDKFMPANMWLLQVQGQVAGNENKVNIEGDEYSTDNVLIQQNSIEPAQTLHDQPNGLKRAGDPFRRLFRRLTQKACNMEQRKHTADYRGSKTASGSTGQVNQDAGNQTANNQVYGNIGVANSDSNETFDPIQLQRNNNKKNDTAIRGTYKNPKQDQAPKKKEGGGAKKTKTQRSSSPYSSISNSSSTYTSYSSSSTYSSSYSNISHNKGSKPFASKNTKQKNPGANKMPAKKRDSVKQKKKAAASSSESSTYSSSSSYSTITSSSYSKLSSRPFASKNTKQKNPGASKMPAKKRELVKQTKKAAASSSETSTYSSSSSYSTITSSPYTKLSNLKQSSKKEQKAKAKRSASTILKEFKKSNATGLMSSRPFASKNTKQKNPGANKMPAKKRELVKQTKKAAASSSETSTYSSSSSYSIITSSSYTKLSNLKQSSKKEQKAKVKRSASTILKEFKKSNATGLISSRPFASKNTKQKNPGANKLPAKKRDSVKQTKKAAASSSETSTYSSSSSYSIITSSSYTKLSNLKQSSKKEQKAKVKRSASTILKEFKKSNATGLISNLKQSSKKEQKAKANRSASTILKEFKKSNATELISNLKQSSNKEQKAKANRSASTILKEFKKSNATELTSNLKRSSNKEQKAEKKSSVSTILKEFKKSNATELIRDPCDPKGRKRRLVFQANIQLLPCKKKGEKHLAYKGLFLCDWRKRIDEYVSAHKVKVRPSLKSFLPLWGNLINNCDPSDDMELPNMVLVNHKNKCKGIIHGTN